MPMADRGGSRRAQGQLGPAARVAAGVLAAVWLLAGIAALLLALVWDRRIGFVAGPPAIAYGLVWLHVVRTGRLLGWRLRRR